jgi:hypothetical protein
VQASALAHLMGAYFHQDWFDGGTEDNVVACFLREQPDLLPALVNDIEVALVAHDDEESLRDFLRTLGCAYNPDRTYGGYRTWLQEVSRRAKAHTRSE